MRECDLCGAAGPQPLLTSPRLDGPLVRCRRCGLVYVGARASDFTFAAGADPERSEALAARVRELSLVCHEVEDAERRWRLAADRERLTRLRRFVAGGRLLDVGSSLGTFLEVAAAAFDAVGVEPDPITREQATAAGLRVAAGTLEDVEPPPGGFDAITMHHVIEHVDSPTAVIVRAAELLRPGGVILIETPTVENPWFRVAPARWRQLIPDHYFFFSRQTLYELLRRSGFEPLDHAKVGRQVSLRFLADRLRRSGMPLAGTAQAAVQRLHLGDRSVWVNPGDIMSVVARRA